MDSCAVHPQSPAFGPCQTCRKPFCDSCLAFDMGRACAPCFEAARAKRRIVWGVVGALVVAGVTALAISGRRANAKTEAARAAKAAEEAKALAEPVDLRLARRKWDQAPCDYTAALDVVDELMKIGRHAEALDAIDGWRPNCGEPRKLRWRKYKANLDLERYPQAAAVATELIATKPADADFWWWRADANVHGAFAAALADFRQSMANTGQEGRSNYVAGIMLREAEATPQACQAVWTANYFVRMQGGTLSRDADRAYQAIMFKHRCGELTTGSTATFTPPKGSAPAVAEISINRREISALVDERAGTSVMTLQLATTLGLTVSDTRIDALVMGTLTNGRLAAVPELTFGGVTLRDVEVMVVDKIGDGREMVLGFNALWRLQPTVKATAVELTPWVL